jgi:hypothetical protein
MRLGLATLLRLVPPVIAALVASPLLGTAAESPGPQGPRLSEERDASRPAGRPVREPAFELVGVVKLDGSPSFALLQEPELTMGSPVLIQQGQSIGDYRLVAVEDDWVRLDSATGSVTVMLGGSSGRADTVTPVLPKLEPAARQAPSQPDEALPPPRTEEPQDARAAGPVPTAEESVRAALKGTRGEKVLNTLKNALGLGATQDPLRERASE